jgi:methionyl-tRNA formyltransferase
LRLVFAGTPEFAVVALHALADAGHEIPLVLTQPDRQAGRGLALRASAVKQAALSRGLAVAQPVSLRDESVQAQLAALAPEVMVVAAYGLILPPAVLAIPRRGCVNIHASLLPRWRGAAPIQRAILAGDRETGITIMQMAAGLDTGPILRQAPVAIGDEDTAGALHDRLAALGAREIVSALASPGLPQSQDEARATYADKITARDAWIDWTRPAIEIARRIRALNPAPGAATMLDGKPVKLWRAQPGAGEAVVPGTVAAVTPESIVVGCGTGALVVTELQRAGSRRMPAGAFAAGLRLKPGTSFDAAPPA